MFASIEPSHFMFLSFETRICVWCNWNL